MTANTDIELVNQTMRGDRQAFGQLVKRHQSLVCSVAYCIVGDFARSEEVAQEAFLAGWKQLSNLHDPAKFSSWICGIVRNLALTVARREQKTQPLDAAQPMISTEPSPSDQAVAREEQALVWNALEALPDSYREPLVLFYREHNSVARVADALELSEDAVKQRLSRGRELLREEIAATIERTLRRTAPKAVFVLTVLGALPGIGATTASAASVATAGKVSAPVAASSVSFVGPLIDGATGVLGTLFGLWVGDQATRYERERQTYRRGILIFLLVWCFIFPISLLALIAAFVAGWNPIAALGPIGYSLALIILIVTFTLGGLALELAMILRMRQIVAEEIVSGAAPLPLGPVRRFLSGFEGRSWTSHMKLFGLPLIDIQTQDPSDALVNFPFTFTRPFARGWLAIGDRACGLIAIGYVAIGGVAIGVFGIGGFTVAGLGLGLVSLCGLGGGGLAIGGMAIGWFACGGLAVGWYAFGGAAIAWRAAEGGLAIAHDFAIGGEAFATHANDADATTYFESTFLSRIWHAIGIWVDLIDLGALLIVITYCLLSYRRRPSARS